jgi:hypothetical protein
MAFDYGGMLLPFQIAFVLLVFTTIFAALFLPYIDPTPPLTSPTTTETDPKKKKQSLLTPLKIFIPKRRLVDGKGRWDFNLFFLASGAFFSVLATGYVGMGLQLVATNVFGWVDVSESSAPIAAPSCRHGWYGVLSGCQGFREA